MLCVCVCGSFRVFCSFNIECDMLMKKYEILVSECPVGNLCSCLFEAEIMFFTCPKHEEQKKRNHEFDQNHVNVNNNAQLVHKNYYKMVKIKLNCLAQSQLSKLVSCNSMFDCRAKLSRASSAKPQALFRLLLIYPQCQSSLDSNTTGLYNI